ncbi:hypothetical protein HHI36_019791 [Cryptolaemus montrouzieri]|uniref:Uncharacterized protein n=1 Tax=Cryptolaemus montrouzieri TaxID=559131 RepID=A0ABD2N8U5_9CUCU
MVRYRSGHGNNKVSYMGNKDDLVHYDDSEILKQYFRNYLNLVKKKWSVFPEIFHVRKILTLRCPTYTSCRASARFDGKMTHCSSLDDWQTIKEFRNTRSFEHEVVTDIYASDFDTPTKRAAQ